MPHLQWTGKQEAVSLTHPPLPRCQSLTGRSLRIANTPEHCRQMTIAVQPLGRNCSTVEPGNDRDSHSKVGRFQR